MKTLAEVILAYELCSEGKCEECPYRLIAPNLGYMPCDPTERESDVLHYLKAHKNQQDFYDDGIKRTTEMIDKCEKTVAEYLAVNNPPLTWDELREMEGKPVWVEGDHGCIWGQKSWALIKFTHDGDMLCLIVEPIVGEFYIGEEDYGTDWQAYRKERS